MQMAAAQCLCKGKVSADFGLREALQSLMLGFREVYYINLKENYYYMLHPKLDDKTERGNYKETIVKHFESGLILDEDRKNVWEFLQPFNIRRALRHADTTEYRYRRMTPEGEPEWCMATFSVCKHTGTDVETVILSIRSIEELVRKEEQQRNALELALMQAKSASQAKTMFLSNMSHDIRTPMNAIIGFTDLVRNHVDEPEYVKGYLDKIALSSDHLLGLINDVLDLSKIESGKMQLHEEPKSITRMFTKLYDILKGQAAEKNIRFEVMWNEIRHDLIWADELRIEQMLINLAGNAVKYTPEGGTIIVRIAEEDSDSPSYGNYLITVRDNGIGINPEYLPKIFEAFSRDENAAVLQNEGAGLGLSITKSIVELSGGTIDVESTLGEGTCFTVRIPFLLAEEEEVHKRIPEPADKAAVDFSNKRILLAEDNLFSAEIAAEYLENMGFIVDTVNNGREAVDMLLSKEPGTYFCILMDLQMPVLDGISAAKEIRALSDKRLSAVPIIAMTANVFAEDQQRTKEAGMNGHIIKPVDRQILQSVLLQVQDINSTYPEGE